MMQKFAENKAKLTTAYLENKKYYDQKASAKTIPEKLFCILLNPKLLEKSTKTASQVQKFELHTDSIYINRKENTNYTQCVRRIRLKPIKPSDTSKDLEEINQANFSPDTSRQKHKEPDLLDKHIPELIKEQKESKAKTKAVIPDPVRATVCPSM